MTDRDPAPPTALRRQFGGGMYPALYWAGVATLVVWTVYSAYATIIGH
jgi:hypothetical protein